MSTNNNMKRGKQPRIPRDNGYGLCVLGGFVLVLIAGWLALLFLFASTSEHYMSDVRFTPAVVEANQTE